LGAVYTLGGVVSGMMLIGKKKDEPEIFNTGRTSARALVDALIVGYGLKYVTARERPTDNEGQGRFWKGGDSFPSGHVIDSWAVTTVIVRSRSPKWLKVTSLSIATAVTLSRWGAQRHFPSDLFAGGVMGVLIGNFVATHQDSGKMLRP
jgi:undecaprenyl-diphosphatase